jgi:predicted deacylase
VSVYSSLKEVPKEKGKYLARVPVTIDMNGMEVVIWTHVLVGAQPGPTLALLAGLHGDEWLHLQFFRKFVETFDPDAVSGSVMLMPIANAVAFGSLSRCVHDDSDSPDANRAFPGGTGRKFNWLADQVAATIATEVLTVTDYLLDFHLGIWGVTMGSSIVGIDYSDEEVNRKSLDMSLAFGTPLVMMARMIKHWPGPKSSQSYAGEVLGIPASGSMLGGAGFDRDLEKTWMDDNLQGVYNVMTFLDMMPGEMNLPKEYLVYESVQRISPKTGGFLVPANEVETFGREIREGELLGRIVSPFTLKTIEELVVPVDGYLAYWPRSYPLRPGEWAYAVIPKDHAGTRWIENPLSAK